MIYPLDFLHKICVLVILLGEIPPCSISDLYRFEIYITITNYISRNYVLSETLR